MRSYPQRAPAVVPDSDVIDVHAIPLDGERPPRSLSEAVLRHRSLILVFTTVVVAAVALWIVMARPIYEASVVLQIDPERPRVVSFPDIAPPEEAHNERVVEAYYQTQLGLIGSRTVLERVVESLKLREHPAFTRAADDRVSRVLSLFPWPQEPPNTADLVEALEQRLRIEPIKRSRLVRISARLPDRELAALVPNQIAQQYIVMTNTQRHEASEAAARWLEAQLGGLRQRTEQTTGVIQQFVQQQGLVPTREGRTEFALQQLNDLNRVYTDAENDRIQKEARDRMLTAADSDTLAAALGSELIRNLKTEYARLERELGRVKTVYGPEHPRRIELEAEVELAKPRLEAEIQKARQAVQQDYQASVQRAMELGRRLDAQRETAILRHAQQMQLQLLRKEADTTQSVYADLMKRLKEVQIASQLRVTNVKVADPARRPIRPSSPRPARDLLLATVGGLICGIALAFVREARDSTLHTPREVSGLIRLPSLGVIPSVPAYQRRALPAVGDLPARALSDHTMSSTAQLAGEAFRALRALVRQRRGSQSARIILVTSAQPREGKSFTAVNLAVSLAEGGDPVVLVDADFHRSSCHRPFGLEPPRVGLSSILSSDLAPEDAVLGTGVDNLSFLPAGPRPPDPPALLSSEKAQILLATLRERFAWVIIDSPPVLAVSDAAVLAPLVDGVLLIVRAHATPTEAVQIARDRLEALGVRMLGVVLNDARPSHNPYFCADYGYQHGRAARTGAGA